MDLLSHLHCSTGDSGLTGKLEHGRRLMGWPKYKTTDLKFDQYTQYRFEYDWLFLFFLFISKNGKNTQIKKTQQNNNKKKTLIVLNTTSAEDPNRFQSCDNLIYSSYSSTTKMCSADYLPACHSNWFTFFFNMDFNNAHLCGVPTHFNWFNLQLNQARRKNVKPTSVHSSSDTIVFPNDQSENYQSQLCKSMHVLLCRQRATVYMNRRAVCRWSHAECIQW